MDSLITLTVDVNWDVDGNLIAEFRRHGYFSTIWKAGQFRRIPRSLAEACKRSGAPLGLVEEGMPEDSYREPVEPIHLAASDAERELSERYAREPRVKVLYLGVAGGMEGAPISETLFRDGNLSAEFAALDRPPEIGWREIVELPPSLLKKCENSGALFTTDAGEIAAFEGHFQARYTHPLESWRKERRERIQAEQERRRRELLDAETARILAEEQDKKIQSARNKALKELGYHEART